MKRIRGISSGSPLPQVHRTFSRLSDEVGQGHSLRKPLYEAIQTELGADKWLIAFFTAFNSTVMIDDQDADMLEEALQNMDMSGKQLVLMINSPGGDALAAERIVTICRSYSPTGFSVIVPKMAKSASTMICFGATGQIYLSATSELGPIDPQIPIRDDDGRVFMYCAAHEILESYQELVRNATRGQGRIEPYLQQLARFDARDIRRIISAQELAESIAVNFLKTGAMNGTSERAIKRKIKPFLDPHYTKVHGRPIYHDVAKRCGLNVQVFDLTSTLWQNVWELYYRLNYLLAASVDKIIESTVDLYTASIHRGQR
ncbi:MAG TPA: hypothetical protein VMH05_16970 [Bryobacteraceae bacterium]|nr:hypothetical protein [Bryobacteraceae bacterium]